MRPGRFSGLKIGSTWETDISSEYCRLCAPSADRQLQKSNAACRIFEAGESDIGHPDRLHLSVPTTSGNVGQHGLSSTAVRIAGVVSSTSAQDIAAFLEGVQLLHGLDSIIFLGDSAFGGGTAVVEVADETALRLALSRNQTQAGSAHLRVLPITAAELASLPIRTGQQDNTLPHQHASAGPAQPQYLTTRQQLTQLSPLNTDGSMLKLRGLPYSASVSDVLTFFEGANILHTQHQQHLCGAHI